MKTCLKSNNRVKSLPQTALAAVKYFQLEYTVRDISCYLFSYECVTSFSRFVKSEDATYVSIVSFYLSLFTPSRFSPVVCISPLSSPFHLL